MGRPYGWRDPWQVPKILLSVEPRLAVFRPTSISSPLILFGASLEISQLAAVLALLYLTITEVDEWGARTWKSHDWDTMDRLHSKGYISDPKIKAKSVVLTPEGLERSRELFERHCQ